MSKPVIGFVALSLAACMTTVSCAAPTIDRDIAASANGPACPDPRSELITVYEKPGCWSDDDWTLYQRLSTQRLRRQYQVNQHLESTQRSKSPPSS